MTLSLTKTHKFFFCILYIVPFVIASFCFIWHLAYTHLGYTPSISEPNSDYTVQYRICREDCSILRDLHCREWIEYRQPKLCEFVCDSYLEQDIRLFSPTFKTILTCVRNATSRKEVEKCKLSCSYFDEL